MSGTFVMSLGLNYCQNSSCVPPNFETLIRNFRVEKSNFELKFSLRPIYLKLCSFSKFGVISCLQSKSQSLQKQSFKEDPKNLMKFQTVASMFQFKISFATSKFPIRVSKLGAHMNRFDCNGAVGLLYDFEFTSEFAMLAFPCR